MAIGGEEYERRQPVTATGEGRMGQAAKGLPKDFQAQLEPKIRVAHNYTLTVRSRTVSDASTASGTPDVAEPTSRRP
jgi:hypothetical protein